MSQLRIPLVASGFLIVLITVLSAVSCQPDKADKDKQASRDSIIWEDSAYHMVTQMDYYYGNDMTDSMEVFAPKAMAFCKQYGKWRYYYKIWAYNAMDMVWRGLFKEAVNEATKMQEDALSRKQAYGHMYAYQVLGIAYGFQKDLAQSADCYKHALAQCLKLPDDGSKFALYSYYCEALSTLKDYATLGSILSEWKTAIDAFPVDPSGPNADVYANWHFKYMLTLANYLIDTKNFKNVEAILDSATYYEAIDGNYPSSLCKLATSRYQYAIEHGDNEEAMRQTELMIKYSKGSDWSNYILALGFRSNVLEKVGNYREALADLKRSHDLNDSILASENNEQLNTLNKRLELNELKLDAEHRQMKAEERQMWLIVLIAVVILVALTLFMIYRHRATAKLEREHKKLGEAFGQLEVANAKAEESLRMKSEFIRQITHEINTPLNILSGFTQVITTPGLELDKQERADLNQGIVENTNRISELVNKVIDLSETNSQTILERTDTVEASQIATDAIERCGISEAPHLQFSQLTAADAEHTVITTNRKAAVRALTLLLDNARKFTAPAETEVRHQGYDPTSDVRRAQLSIQTDGTHVSFTVEDTGIGIPPEEAEHIFEEFVQLDNYYDGTGIGLTVARSIARKLGGDVTLDTTYTAGARFVMTLPL